MVKVLRFILLDAQKLGDDGIFLEARVLEWGVLEFVR